MYNSPGLALTNPHRLNSGLCLVGHFGPKMRIDAVQSLRYHHKAPQRFSARKSQKSSVQKFVPVTLPSFVCITPSYKETSDGGSVVTEAGNDPAAVGLVYIAAHMPDSGESEAADGKRFPSALSKSGAIKVTPDGYTYLEPVKFPYYFAPELPSKQSQFMARSQVLNPATSFATTITKAAWRTKPSWMLIAGNHRVIHPKLERWYAERAKSKKIEVAKGACHAVYASRPQQVAALIEEAATSVR